MPPSAASRTVYSWKPSNPQGLVKRKRIHCSGTYASTVYWIGMVAALNTDPPQQAAVDAARHVVEWSRRNPSEARVLLHGATDFGESAWSESARKSTAEAQAALAAALRGLGRRLGASSSRELDRLVIAVVDLPYATVRRYLLSGKPIPAHAARLVEQGMQALLTH